MSYTYVVGEDKGYATPIIEDLDEEVKTDTEDLDKPEEEVEDENLEPQVLEHEDENPYVDYSEAAIYAEELKQTGYFPDDYEVPKTASHQDLLKEMVKHAERISLENIQAQLQSKGWTEEHLQIANYIANGGDPIVFNKVNYFKSLAEAKPDKPEEKEKIVRAMYAQKQLSEEEADELIQIAIDTNKLDDRVRESNKLFSRLHSEHKSQATQPQETVNFEDELNKRNQKIKSIVSKKAIGPFQISDQRANQLLDFVTNPKYLYTSVDEKGQKSNSYVTGYERKFAEVMNDLEKQVILAHILMDDFQIDGLKSQSKKSASVLDFLNRQSSPTRSKANPYYQD